MRSRHGGVQQRPASTQSQRDANKTNEPTTKNALSLNLSPLCSVWFAVRSCCCAPSTLNSTRLRSLCALPAIDPSAPPPPLHWHPHHSSSPAVPPHHPPFTLIFFYSFPWHVSVDFIADYLRSSNQRPVCDGAAVCSHWCDWRRVGGVNPIGITQSNLVRQTRFRRGDSSRSLASAEQLHS